MLQRGIRDIINRVRQWVGRLRTRGASTGSSGGTSPENGGDPPGEYLAGKAPKQVQPGIRILEGQYVDDLGRVQPWRAYYDAYGRQVGRTDFNAGNRAAGIPDIHHHQYEYNAKFPNGWESASHVSGEYTP